MEPAGLETKAMRVHAQGHELDLVYTDEARPTLFSTFLANGLEIEGTDRNACDLGTGGGVQAIALAAMGLERVVAIDRSEVACEIATENVRRNGVEGQVEVVQGDLATLDEFEAFDLLVSNPPTMPDRPGTPGFAAAGGGALGLSFLHRIAKGIDGWLSPRGRAQLALSSLVEPEALEVLRGAGLRSQPQATLLAPFRRFYMTSYDAELLAWFVAEGRALSDGGDANSELSELITIHVLTRA